MKRIDWKEVKKGDYASPLDPCTSGRLTQGALYQITNSPSDLSFKVISDNGDDTLCLPTGDAHLNGGSWAFYRAEEVEDALEKDLATETQEDAPTMERVSWEQVKRGYYAQPNTGNVPEYLSQRTLYRVESLLRGRNSQGLLEKPHGFEVEDDNGGRRTCIPTGDAHLDGGSWLFYRDPVEEPSADNQEEEDHMTPAQEAGLEVGTLALLEVDYPDFPRGSLITLREDDGTSVPFFLGTDGAGRYLSLAHVIPLGVTKEEMKEGEWLPNVEVQPAASKVDVRHRTGKEYTDERNGGIVADDWTITNHPGDILEWRPSWARPSSKVSEASEPSEPSEPTPEPQEEPSMKILAFTGQAGSGKSYLAEEAGKLLRERGYPTYRLAFATPIYRAVAAALDLPVTEVRDLKQQGQAANGISVRRLLQTLGTEWGRGHKEDFWVDLLERRARDLTDAAPSSRTVIIIIDDLRFPNEASFVQKHKGVIIGVVPLRTSESPADHHASETSLPWGYCHDIIRHDYEGLGPMGEAILRKALDRLVEGESYKRGDHFRDSYGDEYLLSVVNDDGEGRFAWTLISLDDGNRWSSPVMHSDALSLPKSKLEEIASGHTMRLADD